MEKKFNATPIPEDYSKLLSQQSLLVGPTNVFRVATTLFHGASRCLGAMKSTTVPKALVFRSLDHGFLAGAKVEFIPNKDDPTNPASGRWDYTWTFYEDDLKGADTIEIANNTLATTYFASSGQALYNMKFAGTDVCITMVTLMVEMIVNWLRENATEVDPAVLILDGVFRAEATVVKGKIEMGLVPDGEMKVLIKDDAAIQEA